MFSEFCEKLKKYDISFSVQEPMREHTSFKIGGNADFLITANSLDELKTVVTLCKESGVPIMIMGNGTNLLVSDSGIKGAVIRLDGDFKSVTVEDDTIVAGAGASLTRVCLEALKNGLEGMEFAYGIPGSVGGAVFMNAGAYGGEMKDVVDSAEHLNKNLCVQNYSVCQMELSYRHSVYMTEKDILLFVKFKLKHANPQIIKDKMDELMQKRKSKQPLEYPSAGSVFRRPEGAYAAALIEQCGLKGKAVGDAAVSEKHSGFIINKGSATCSDVLRLISIIQNEVKLKTGFELKREIIYVKRED